MDGGKHAPAAIASADQDAGNNHQLAAYARPDQQSRSGISKSHHSDQFHYTQPNEALDWRVIISLDSMLEVRPKSSGHATIAFATPAPAHVRA